jgi:hypothetical protein
VICDDCTRAGRRASGSPFPGYCDACGWALCVDADGNETSARIRPSTEAAALVVKAALWRESPPGFSGSAFEHDGSLRLDSVPKVARGIAEIVGSVPPSDTEGT